MAFGVARFEDIVDALGQGAFIWEGLKPGIVFAHAFSRVAGADHFSTVCDYFTGGLGVGPHSGFLLGLNGARLLIGV